LWRHEAERTQAVEPAMAIAAQDGYVAGHDPRPMPCRPRTSQLERRSSRIRRRQRAFEAAGIEFSDHGAPGVRQLPAPAVLRVDELNASNDD